MTKGTTSFGKRHSKTHVTCRRCGRRTFHIQKKTCSSCGYPASKMRRCKFSLGCAALSPRSRSFLFFLLLLLLFLLLLLLLSVVAARLQLCDCCTGGDEFRWVATGLPRRCLARRGLALRGCGEQFSGWSARPSQLSTRGRCLVRPARSLASGLDFACRLEFDVPPSLEKVVSRALGSCEVY